MSFDKEDYEKTRSKAPKDDRQTLTMLHQRALKAELLTGDSAWDTYLSFIQDAIAKNTEQRDAFVAQLANPYLVNADKIAQVRINVIRLNERVEMLNTVIALPSEIKRIGALAAEKLKALTAIEETQGA